MVKILSGLAPLPGRHLKAAQYPGAARWRACPGLFFHPPLRGESAPAPEAAHTTECTNSRRRAADPSPQKFLRRSKGAVRVLAVLLLLFLSGCKLVDRVRNLLDSDDSGTVAVRVGEKKFNKAD